MQREIVAEIEGYQKVIDGARAVVANYRPHIPIDPAWPMVEIGEACCDVTHSMKAGPFGSSLKNELRPIRVTRFMGRRKSSETRSMAITTSVRISIAENFSKLQGSSQVTFSLANRMAPIGKTVHCAR